MNAGFNLVKQKTSLVKPGLGYAYGEKIMLYPFTDHTDFEKKGKRREKMKKRE